VTTGATILEQIIKPQAGDFSPEHARYVLSLAFSAEQQARHADLASRVQEGKLSKEEEAELDEFVKTSMFLAILQSKARISLSKRNPAA
jgi:hypothetical protein